VRALITGGTGGTGGTGKGSAQPIQSANARPEMRS